MINTLRLSGQHEEDLHKFQLSLKKTIEDRDNINRELQKALDETITSKDIIPICSYCHYIRDDNGTWGQMEQHITTYSEVYFSHGICPRCMPKVLDEFGLKDNEK